MKTIKTDILIVGGGSAGIAAAIGASHSGRKVVLIEQLSYLGGKATAAEVGTICGLYKFSKNSPSEYIVKGFAKKFADELQKRSDTDPLHNIMGLHYLPYQIEDYKKLCADLMQEHQIKVVLNSEVTQVTKSNNKIESVIIRSKDEDVFINSGSFIDCSGNSIVSQLANLPIITSEVYQAAAQIFTLSEIDESNEAKLGMILMRDIQKGIANNELESYYDRLSIVQGSIRNGKVSFKLGLPIPVTHKKNNLEELKTVAQQMIQVLLEFLNKNSTAFNKAKLFQIADEVGIRVGIRPQGKYVLTSEDVLSCKKFDHAVANGSWPVESWGQDKRVHMKYFEPDNYYQIPAECLISSTCDNLFFAGRNISADDDAIASARVMGICFQTGYAAGKLASGLITKEDVRLTIKAIQQEQIF